MNRVTSKQLRFVAGAGLIALATTAAMSPKSFGDWSTPASIEALPGSSTSLNTAAVDGCASHSPDGLTLVFNSNRGGNQDLYMATRASVSEGFGSPVALPAPVNSSSNEACATIANGKRIYFSSDRDDSAYDLYVTRSGPKGWSAPTRLGPNINTKGTLDEVAAFYEDDEGREVMIFTRRIGAAGKLYQSIDGGPATLVQGGPHSSASDLRASVTHNGRTIFWDSTRSGSLGGPDIWYATRSNTSEPWGQAIHLPELSSAGLDVRPFINWDGNFLTMSSNRAGSESAAPDIWFTAR
ncbi:MAG: hypothetical protein ABIP07_04425 [Sphingomicrobium sp.]